VGERRHLLELKANLLHLAVSCGAMVVRIQALAVLALHVLGNLAAPTGESSAGLALAADGKIKKLFNRQEGGGEDDELVEKDADGIVVCPLKVDSCLAARQAQIEASEKAKAAKIKFNKAKKNLKKSKEAMADAEAMKAGPKKSKAKKKAGKKMEFWGKKQQQYGNEFGEAKNEWGAANRVANEEATNERKAGKKVEREDNASEREEKKKAREACSGSLNDAGECVHGGAVSA
jgi:uncharacterized protein (DUF2147 family)